MSQYPPPSESEVSAYSNYPPVTLNPDGSRPSLGYTPPGNPIDPSLGGAQVIHSDVEHDALQQLQDAAALQDAELTSQAATQAAAAAAAAQAARQADKLKRVAQACDACSQRKVKVSSEGAFSAIFANSNKCDAGNPCKNCSDLDVECTRNRQRRRRGPPNRVKERMESEKRTRGANDLDVSTAVALSREPQAFDSSVQSSADLIAPPDIVQRLLSEFFTYVYPIYPFPHEPWLMQAFNRRADIGDSSYNPLLALISSMIAVLAAMRPRQTYALVGSLGYESIDDLVQRVRNICVNARGMGYLERDDLDTGVAATSFFLAQLSVRAEKWLQYQIYLSEALEIVHDQEMLLLNQDHGLDNIQLQIGRRIYWSTYICTRSMQHWIGLRSRPGYDLTEPAKPSIVDDEHIASDHIQDVAPRDFGPLTLSIDTLIQIYSAADQVLTKHAIPADADLLEVVSKLRKSIEDWSPELKNLINASLPERFNDSNRAIRYEIQRTNLLVSHLILRLSLLEKTSKTSARGVHDQQVQDEFVNIAEGLLFLFKDLRYHAIEFDQTFFLSRVQRITSSFAEHSKTVCEGGLYETVLRFEELFKDLVRADDEAQKFHASNELRAFQDTLIRSGRSNTFVPTLAARKAEA